MIKNKKASHVGMILSFLIFVTFLTFLYSVTQPLTRVKQDKLDLLKFIKVELANQFIEDMSVVTISMESVSGCFKLEKMPGLENTGVVAKKQDGTLIDSHFNESTDKTSIKDDYEILKLYYSKEFSNGTAFQTACDGLVEGIEYNISIFTTTEETFESKIVNLSNYIGEDLGHYEEIKNVLGLPLKDNFGFTFLNGTKEFIVGTEDKDVATDIYVEELPIQYIDSEANINPGFLVIRVW